MMTWPWRVPPPFAKKRRRPPKRPYRSPLACVDCGREPKGVRPFRLNTCPDCRSLAAVARADRARQKRARRLIDTMSESDLHAYIRELSWRHETGRALGGNPVVLRRLRELARTAAERINALDG